jgi:hypothetical protein
VSVSGGEAFHRRLQVVTRNDSSRVQLVIDYEEDHASAERLIHVIRRQAASAERLRRVIRRQEASTEEVATTSMVCPLPYAFLLA